MNTLGLVGGLVFAVLIIVVLTFSKDKGNTGHYIENED